MPVPCETLVGCAKGHWKDKPDLNRAEQALLDAWYAGPEMLCDSDKRSAIVRRMFALLNETKETIERVDRLMMFAKAKG